MYAAGSLGMPWVKPPLSALHNGKLKEGAPMTMEQARAAIKAATDTTALPAIQLRPLSPDSELPPHAALTNEASAISAKDLATVILNQSLAFMDGVFPAFSIQEMYAKSKGSSATVTARVLERGKEKWSGRNSMHANQRADGTADWDQFNQGLRTNHNKQQLEYSDGVEDAYKVCEWTVEGIDGWKDITIEVFEMLHKSRVSNPRCYPVLVVTASLTESPQFIVAQVPADLSGAVGARYANGNNTTDFTANTSSTMGQKSSVTECVSIDRVKLEPNPKSPDAEAGIVWEFAICSNAKGAVSSSIARLDSKPAVAKDVGTFIDWVSRK